MWGPVSNEALVPLLSRGSSIAHSCVLGQCGALTACIYICMYEARAVLNSFLWKTPSSPKKYFAKL